MGPEPPALFVTRADMAVAAVPRRSLAILCVSMRCLRRLLVVPSATRVILVPHSKALKGGAVSVIVIKPDIRCFVSGAGRGRCRRCRGRRGGIRCVTETSDKERFVIEKREGTRQQGDDGARRARKSFSDVLIGRTRRKTGTGRNRTGGPRNRPRRRRYRTGARDKGVLLILGLMTSRGRGNVLTWVGEIGGNWGAVLGRRPRKHVPN